MINHADITIAIHRAILQAGTGWANGPQDLSWPEIRARVIATTVPYGCKVVDGV
jgi:hypothetical protein